MSPTRRPGSHGVRAPGLPRARGAAPLRRFALGAALATLAGPLCRPAAAQTVTGDVVAEENAQPLQAALIALVDSAGQRRLGVLTDSAGHFVVRAPGPGRYRVLLSHIGRKATFSDEVTLGAGATVRIHLEAPIAPLLLRPIVVDTRSRCKLRPEVGELASDLWEEARKAMAVAAVARGTFRGRVRTYRRELDAHSLAVLRESAAEHPILSARAFGSATEAELHRQGYVHRDGTDWVYEGPDELVLGSEGFMDHHCLQPVRGDAEHAGLVGVAFKPVQDDRPDIEGVAWLDARSAVLRSVQFHYTALPWSVPVRTQGGEVLYGRLSSGVVAVTSWSLRMPQVELKRAFRAPGQGASLDPLAIVLRVIEAGGEALPASAAPAPAAQ